MHSYGQRSAVGLSRPPPRCFGSLPPRRLGPWYFRFCLFPLLFADLRTICVRWQSTLASGILGICGTKRTALLFWLYWRTTSIAGMFQSTRGVRLSFGIIQFGVRLAASVLLSGGPLAARVPQTGWFAFGILLQPANTKGPSNKNPVVASNCCGDRIKMGHGLGQGADADSAP